MEGMITTKEQAQAFIWGYEAGCGYSADVPPGTHRAWSEEVVGALMLRMTMPDFFALGEVSVLGKPVTMHLATAAAS